ncbi:hypothetical protein MMC11_005897 [Xylographa trunciseda]|nr:hypothetical protein [Xylographa trunciseda]
MATSGMGTPGLFTPATPTTAYGAMAPPYTPFTSSGANRPLRIVGSLTTSQTGNVQNRHMMPNGGSNLGQYSWRGETRGEEMDGPMSPGNKRRRVDNGPSTPVRAQAGQLTPFPFSQRRESLPRPDFMPKSNFPLAAPPKSNHHSSSSHDSSLTLPPLKTGAASDAFSQAKSVEAMIMSILPINKIKILAKITPRLASPGPASPPHATRGVIIAVDGADHEAVNMVVAHLEDIFSKDETHKLRIWDSPTIEADASLADYLGVITRWHAISTELIEYITTVPSPTSPPPVSPKTQAPILPLEDHDNPLEPEKASPASTAADAPPSSTAAGAPLLPIAIVPRYQLTLTDLAASTIPIADAYAPVDHWQWMATLWRGIVGPDITIVVRPASNQYDGSSANGNSSPREETRNGGGVEVRLQDARTITLLCPNVGKVPESALRRMGFELGEYVRYLKTGERWT